MKDKKEIRIWKDSDKKKGKKRRGIKIRESTRKMRKVETIGTIV